MALFSDSILLCAGEPNPGKCAILIRRYRKERGLSQGALADAVGLAVTYVGQIERGLRNPTLAVVEKFAPVLRVDPLDLLK